MNTTPFVFFGTSQFAVIILQTLKDKGVIPSLIVTTPDTPQGRKLILTPPKTKVWALENNIPFIQPQTLDAAFLKTIQEKPYSFFLVASYGKILPASFLDAYPHKVLNIHPSLLPKLRGASPLQEAILSEKETGVTIMEIDTQMDHGPIITQKKIPIPNWPIRVDLLEELLATEGAKLFVDTLSHWLEGTTHITPQDHSQATYTSKIQKKDGLIDFSDSPENNYKKILAYYGWPGTYFFAQKKGLQIRVLIKEAALENNALKLLRVLPEGGKEISWADFEKTIDAPIDASTKNL